MARFALLALMSAAIAVPLLAQNAKLPQPPPADPALALPETLGIGYEQSNRMTVPVSIGASGPYRFIIDTGAERSVVSNELASTLNLAAGRRVKVTTMAGQSELRTFLLPALQVSLVKPDTLEAPAVSAADLGAPGMLGIDALKGHAVAIDFDRNVMEVRPATKRRVAAGPDDVVIRAKNLYGQLIVTNASYRGRRISVVIDTGSPVTIGNLAMLKRVRTEKSLGQIGLIAVTGQWLHADYRVIDSLEIAKVGFHSIPIAFADALPFKRFGLTDTPALMLGMDTLKLFRRVQIDFANREIRLTLPKDAIVDRGRFE
ncbi:MAG: clan AA aspartic protease [Sphingomonas sp.]|uniref:retropepsin-like aspartic protease n=1 Tax=Sphingomonas sp. TaxID=28214 RepID=UPI001AC81A1F|nr:retropepsin-like aspartic protease [Sphingomonas sp.]MBN8815758.1 clan AA aspartic protease [Sphingomonas sp.]